MTLGHFYAHRVLSKPVWEGIHDGSIGRPRTHFLTRTVQFYLKNYSYVAVKYLRTRRTAPSPQKRCIKKGS